MKKLFTVVFLVFFGILVFFGVSFGVDYINEDIQSPEVMFLFGCGLVGLAAVDRKKIRKPGNIKIERK